MEEDAWGYVEDDEYDDNYGAGGTAAGGGYGSTSAQEQENDDRTTDDFLGDAVRNLIETEELGEEGLAMLAAQREMLANIKNNVDRMDNSLNDADRVISEMESPWALKGTRVTKHSGNRSAITDDFADGIAAGFNMEGLVLKRGRTMKAWQTRYFKQDGSKIEYTPKKNDPPSKIKTIDLKGAQIVRLSYGETDSNGVAVDKDNCFEIIRAGRPTGDTIHVEATSDYRTWVGAIERQIRLAEQAARGPNDAGAGKTVNRKGVGFGNAKQDAMLDTILDKLDNVDGIARTMGSEVDDQTRIIENLTGDMDRLNERVEINKNRVTKIK